MNEHLNIYTLKVANSPTVAGYYHAQVYLGDRLIGTTTEDTREQAIEAAKQLVEWHRNADHSTETIEL